MDPELDPLAQQPQIFRLFTKESLVRIERRIAEEREAKERAEAERTEGEENEEKKEEDKPRPNEDLEAGKAMPPALQKMEFPRELFGKPIEDLDEFYANKYVSGLLHWH